MLFVSVQFLPFAPSPARGQDLVSVSMQDAIVRTLQLSPVVQVQKEKVKQSRALAEQSAGAFDWVVFGNTETYAEEDEDVSLNTSVGATKRFRNGIEITPSFSKAENSKISTRFIEQNGSILNLKILVPLLRGLGAEHSGAEEQAANFNWTASQYQSKHDISASVSKTASRFWDSASRVLGSPSVRTFPVWMLTIVGTKLPPRRRDGIWPVCRWNHPRIRNHGGGEMEAPEASKIAVVSIENSTACDNRQTAFGRCEKTSKTLKFGLARSHRLATFRPPRIS